jgi:hypothetical protein
MPRKRRSHYRREALVANDKGWQVMTPIPGSDDFVEQWFDYRFKRLFTAWLRWDLEHPESGSTVRWVGF